MSNQNSEIFNGKLEQFGYDILYFMFYPIIQMEVNNRRDLLNSISIQNKFKIDIRKYIKS